MDFTTHFKSLLKEVFKFKQYKDVSSVTAILGIIAVLPFIIDAALYSVLYLISMFFFAAFSSGAEYLEDWVKQTKKGVSNPAEAAIYLTTTPLIFLIRFALSAYSFAFFVLWFVMQCVFYIATLGGTKWRPYITKVNFDDSIDDYTPTTNGDLAGFVSFILAGLSITFWVFFILFRVDASYFDVYYIISIIYFASTSLFIPLVFRKEPKANSAATSAPKQDTIAKRASEAFYAEKKTNETDTADPSEKAPAVADELPQSKPEIQEKQIKQAQAKEEKAEQAEKPLAPKEPVVAPQEPVVAQEPVVSPREPGKPLSAYNYNKDYLKLINVRFSLDISPNDTLGEIKEKISNINPINTNEHNLKRKIGGCESFEDMFKIWEWFSKLYLR